MKKPAAGAAAITADRRPAPRTDPGDRPAGWREILTQDYRLSLALVCLGVWLHAADGLLVATMMPAIVADIGGAHLIAWSVALYELGSITAGAASGLLALRYGTRPPMAAAALLFAAGCALSAAAPQMWLLLAGRLLQGFGGGGLMAISFVAVGLLFPKRLVARVMGAVSTLWATSAFFGPLIGGLFVEWGSWRAAFVFFAAQAVLLAAWLALSPTPKPAADTAGAKRFPIARLLWLSAGVVLIAYAGVDIAPVRTPLALLAGLACLGFFLKLDGAKNHDRLLPKRPLDLNNPVGAALTMIVCFTAATIAASIYVPFLLVQLHALSALAAGYVIAVEAIAWALSAALLSGAAERHDPKLILLGMLIVSASIVGFAYSVGYGPLWLVVVCSALQGCGFGMAWTFILRRATTVAAPGEVQRVAAAIPTVQRLGYALGAAYVGIVANAAGIADGGPRCEADECEDQGVLHLMAHLSGFDLSGFDRVWFDRVWV